MAGGKLDGIAACVFDAYGTLFDVAAAARHCQADLGDKWQPLSDAWRLRQLQYSWLRSLMGAYTDFWTVTGEALDFAMASVGVDDRALRDRLLELYRNLDCYPEVPGVLKTLKANGFRTAILSNGSPDMLASAVANAGIGELLDEVISVHEVGIFKPDMRIYQLAVDRFGLAPRQISFQSSNAWDAHAASHFGFRVVWCNRFGQARERLPGAPDIEVSSLQPLPGIVGAA